MVATTILGENEWNDPPFLSGQERRSSRREVPGATTTTSSIQSNSSGSRFIKYVPKFTIDHLMEHYYEFKISNDIDLDPCKTGN